MMNITDYLVFAIILLIPILVGFYFGYKSKINRWFKIESKQKTDLSEYLLASSEMESVPIAFSLLATFVSTTTLLGMPRLTVKFKKVLKYFF